jgi:cytochrome c oxidase subunit I
MAPGGIILPEFYNSMVTMHGTFMIFFAIMPLLVGVFGNLLIPLQIGAPDMAFPRLNMLSFWLAVPGGIHHAGQLLGGGGAAGRVGRPTPLSASGEYTGVYLGQQLWLVSLFILGFSSIAGRGELHHHRDQHAGAGLTWFRLPLTVWALFITAILVLLAMPILAGALIMLLTDQTIGTTFFLPEHGGEPLLWQHLFWFFGHPEVYILILPAMGIVSEVIANGARKPIFGYHAMVLAIIAIAFLGWIVWGHHMFMSGMNPMLGTTFMVTTMVIAVPSAIKVFNWLGTLWKGNIHFHPPFLHSAAFVSLFIIGGLSGIFMASTPVDIQIHDTYFIVAHIHYVLFGGSLFAIFAGITFWYPEDVRADDERDAEQGPLLGTFLFYNLAFFPMHGLGLEGMMRRIYDPTQYEYLQRTCRDLEHLHHRTRPSRSWPSSSSSRSTSSGRCGRGRRRAPTRGGPTRWSGPCPRRRRTATSSGCRWSTAGRTSTARRIRGGLPPQASRRPREPEPAQPDPNPTSH